MVVVSRSAVCALVLGLFSASTSAFSLNNNNGKSVKSAAAFHVAGRISNIVDEKKSVMMKMSTEDGGEFDFDVAVIGCGVGGHGAALHSRAQDLKTAVFAGNDVGGTCVNRGCVPSKALLAASGRVREMQDSEHLKGFGIEMEGEVKFDRAAVAAHAKNLANRVKGNLEASLVGLGVEVVEGRGILTGNPHEIKDSNTGKVYTAKVSHLQLFLSYQSINMSMKF